MARRDTRRRSFRCYARPLMVMFIGRSLARIIAFRHEPYTPYVTRLTPLLLRYSHRHRHWRVSHAIGAILFDALAATPSAIVTSNGVYQFVGITSRSGEHCSLALSLWIVGRHANGYWHCRYHKSSSLRTRGRR